MAVIDALGSIALILNLLSMNMTSILLLRWLSLTGNIFFTIYGFLLNATPIVIGCSVAVGIHSYHLLKIYQKRHHSKNISRKRAV